MISVVALSASEILNGLPSRIAENIAPKAAAPFVISDAAWARPACAAFWTTSISASLGMASFGRETTARRAERKRLGDHVVEVLLNDEQFLGDAAQLLQDKLELLYGRGLAQVGVHHQDAVWDGRRVANAQHLGLDVILRLQHRADGWDLRGLIGEKMNKH